MLMPWRILSAPITHTYLVRTHLVRPSPHYITLHPPSVPFILCISTLITIRSSWGIIQGWPIHLEEEGVPPTRALHALTSLLFFLLPITRREYLDHLFYGITRRAFLPCCRPSWPKCLVLKLIILPQAHVRVHTSNDWYVTLYYVTWLLRKYGHLTLMHLRVPTLYRPNMCALYSTCTLHMCNTQLQ